jgi:hypothetical protein
MLRIRSLPFIFVGASYRHSRITSEVGLDVRPGGLCFSSIERLLHNVTKRPNKS